MNRPQMLDKIDQCISILHEVQLWEGEYSHAGLLISNAMTELGRAAILISQDHKMQREGKA